MRPAAMVTERHDRAHPEPADLRQPLVGPREVPLLRMPGRDAFPQRRVAQPTDAQVGKQGQILWTVLMPIAQRLIEPLIAHTIDGAFVPAP